MLLTPNNVCTVSPLSTTWWIHASNSVIDCDFANSECETRVVRKSKFLNCCIIYNWCNWWYPCSTAHLFETVSKLKSMHAAGSLCEFSCYTVCWALAKRNHLKWALGLSQMILSLSWDWESEPCRIQVIVHLLHCQFLTEVTSFLELCRPGCGSLYSSLSWILCNHGLCNVIMLLPNVSLVMFTVLHLYSITLAHTLFNPRALSSRIQMHHGSG